MIDQIFAQYSLDLLQSVKDLEYFDVIRCKREYRGVYKFVKDYCASNYSQKQVITDMYENYVKMLDEILLRESQ